MSSEEVKDAVGEAPAKGWNGLKSFVVELLNGKRRALASAHARYAAAKAARDERAMAEETRLVSSLTVLVTELEQEVVREQESVKRAESRLLGIRRAHGSKRAERERLLTKRLELARLLAENTDQLRGVDADLERYDAEDAALADRFELPRSGLPRLGASGGSAEALEAHRILSKTPLSEHRYPQTPVTEKCEYGLRDRRSYKEIDGTEGYAIIQAAGLKAFPELTERQRKIVSARARQDEETQRQFASLPRVPAQGSSPIGGAF